ncbi:hypothetical protein N7468_002161 [Penicillium chermesinum]|uniref:Pru domain-containing protein n=1 Tax=Penicillium chermesinum TaxID=63820 RepID=A0A9W9TY60_9EURO|nr:uncharacterized protein N7468_002161 [Penicillium chermesinum]KAJ5247178.1 hypothetical protein N7468_002161 [Penicillium chermesinum]
MSIEPIITFKAGICDLDTSVDPPAVKPKPTPGYIYLYSEDELVHFCWRPRSSPLDEPELDLVMIPTDGSFTPYPSSGKSVTNGRVFVLKFSSSSQRHLFWLQSHPQHESGNPSIWSYRDLRLGEIVDTLLQGEDVNMEEEIAMLSHRPSGGDDDETMEDVEGVDHDQTHQGGSSGGAGADATGGDVREEGQESREGGADGGRAANTDSDPSSVVQDFLKSLGGAGRGASQGPDRPSTTLQDLLPPPTTLPFIESADESTADHLLPLLSLDLSQKKDILRKVLRSPQFMQSLSSLTVALRDGGLPSISEALNIKVANGGYMRRGGVPLGGGEAVEAFLDGVRESQKSPDESGRMETD